MTRITQLDGIRGLSALVVVIAHYYGEVQGGVSGLSIGWLGVEVFFVLSGFLIGGVIFDERDRPDFWRGFYIRRAARILPLYLLTVSLVLAMGAATSPWVYLTFTQNMVFAAQGFDAVYTHPLWTLAVEEQFYLLLPLVLVLTPRRYVLPALIALFLGAIAFRTVAYPINERVASLWLFARMDLLTAGVIAAWAKRNLDLSRALMALRIAPIPLLFAASGLYHFVGWGAFLIVGQSLIALAVGAFLLTASLGAPEFRGLLSGRVLGFFGTISYGLYLLHQPINSLLHRWVFAAEPALGTPAQFVVTTVAVGLSILTAWVSWQVFERPILAASRRLLSSKNVGVRVLTA